MIAVEQPLRQSPSFEDPSIDSPIASEVEAALEDLPLPEPEQPECDEWGEWHDCLPSASSPTPREVPPQRVPIASSFFAVAMATGSQSRLVSAFAQHTGRTWGGAVALHDISSPAQPNFLASSSLDVTPSALGFALNSLLVALDDGSLRQMTLPDDEGHGLGAVTGLADEHDAPISALAVSKAGTRAFSCDVTGGLCVWDSANVLNLLSRFPGAAEATLAAHPALERRFASAGGCRVRLWDEEQVDCTLRIAREGALIRSLLWGKSEELLIGWSDGALQLVDIRQSEKPLWSWSGGARGREVLAVASLASGLHAALAVDNCLRVVKDGVEAERFPLSGGDVWGSRCEDKMATALTAWGEGVLVSCRDQTWWGWREDMSSPESVVLPLVRPGEE